MTVGKQITHEQKEVALKTLAEHGTMIAAAKAAGVAPGTLRAEAKRNELFSKRLIEARDTGRTHVGDSALAVIENFAFGHEAKDKTRLTAALALANAFIPGFKGSTQFSGHVDHDVRVVTAIPRPQYQPNQVIEAEVKELPAPTQQPVTPIPIITKPKPVPIQTRISELLQQRSEPMTCSDINRELHAKRVTTSTVLYRMCKEGSVVRDGDLWGWKR